MAGVQKATQHLNSCECTHAHAHTPALLITLVLHISHGHTPSSWLATSSLYLWHFGIKGRQRNQNVVEVYLNSTTLTIPRQSVWESTEVLARGDAAFLSLAMNLIDEKLIKKTPTAVLRHCLTGSLGVLGLPMFTNLKLSTCHCVRDGLLCYVTDIRENAKPNVLSSKGGEEGWLGEWEGRGGLGSRCQTDALDSLSSEPMCSMDVYK